MPSAGPSRKHRRFGSEQSEGDDVTPNIEHPRSASSSSESDDDDAPPEAISLGAGKKQMGDRAKVIREREQMLTRQRKEANKAKAAELKARKDARESVKSASKVSKKSKKHTGPDPGPKESTLDETAERGSDEEMAAEPIDSTALARMQRAMAQAESEDESAEGWGGVQKTAEPQASNRLQPKNRKIPDRLPDSVFLAAKMAEEEDNGQLDKEMSNDVEFGSEGIEEAGERSRKTKGPRNRAKDIIVGSRTVRPLATTKQLGLHISLQRPQAAREFRNKSLNVDGQIAHKPWQRIESHLAVRGQRLGPARNFAQAHRINT